MNILLPIALLSLFIPIIISSYITIFSFPQQIPIPLPQNTTLIKFIATLLLLLLTPSPLSMPPSLPFLPLLIPHITPFLLPSHYRSLIPSSPLLSPLLIHSAHILSPLINPPF
ncbi:iron chelate uptake ABC transporter family permease subunit, partial [Bacillus thuringiensis]|uniref:iron chelate uptake ABC transporter family permease subunit n=1 Tax=Bacillus thuringiensis TaxID=1428 RepID=UPI0037C179B6